MIHFLKTCGEENLQFLLVPARLKKSLDYLDTDGSGELDVDELERRTPHPESAFDLSAVAPHRAHRRPRAPQTASDDSPDAQAHRALFGRMISTLGELTNAVTAAALTNSSTRLARGPAIQPRSRCHKRATRSSRSARARGLRCARRGACNKMMRRHLLG